jgi:beta-glucosidase
VSYYFTSLLFISDGDSDANRKSRFGTYSTTESIKAGLDLEMPGASYIRGKLVSSALACRKLVDKDLDDCVREVLKLVKRVEPLGIPENAPETTVDSKETAQALRTVAANSIVLMKNEKNILPLKKDKTVSRALSVPF